MDNVEKFIKEDNNLIFSIIKDYQKYYDKDDLYQVAIIGLISANKNYKEEFGVKFSTYAYKYILGEIRKYIRKASGIKNNGNNQIIKKIKYARDLLRQKLMKEPSIKDLSLFLEIDEYLIEDALLSEVNLISLETNINNKEKNINLYDVIPVKETIELIDKINLKEEVDNLVEPYKSILQYRYYRDKSQSEVAKILGLSQVNVSRYESKILKKLKCSLSA